MNGKTTKRRDESMASLDEELEELMEAERALKARAFGLPFIPDTE